MTVPRPASEHAREIDLLSAVLVKYRRDQELLDGRDFDPSHHNAADRALASLASALAVVEQERDQLREVWENDAAILAGIRAVRRMQQIRVGDASRHGQTFREAALAAVPSPEPASPHTDPSSSRP